MNYFKKIELLAIIIIILSLLGSIASMYYSTRKADPFVRTAQRVRVKASRSARRKKGVS